MKILIIGPSWVGDMMMSQSLYRLIVRRYSSVQIDVMAPAWCLPLLKYMPEVNRKIEMPLHHGDWALGKRRRLGLSQRENGYQQALILPNSFKSALVPFFANIPKRTGWRGEMRYGLLNDIRILDKNAFPLMVQRYASLAFDSHTMKSADDLPKPLPWPNLLIDIQEIEKVLHAFIPTKTRSLIGFCPGTALERAKCWPHYHYASLAKMLIRCGYQIVLFGSKKDHEIGKAISNMLSMDTISHCYDLIGRTTLEQAITVIAACQCIVSNDSGLMHIASALGRPLIVLYGPSNPDFTPPLSCHARVIRLIVGNYKMRKRNEKQDYHQSLIAIQPAQVFTELKQLLF